MKILTFCPYETIIRIPEIMFYVQIFIISRNEFFIYSLKLESYFYTNIKHVITAWM